MYSSQPGEGNKGLFSSPVSFWTPQEECSEKCSGEGPGREMDTRPLNFTLCSPPLAVGVVEAGRLPWHLPNMSAA
jgi:hypothetical protein